MTPLTNLLVESKKWSSLDIELHSDEKEILDTFTDSLVRKAYELGQQNPKVGFLRQYLNEEHRAFVSKPMWTDEQLLKFLRIPFTGSALDSAIGEVTE